MYEIDELIEFHNECDFLNFKQEEYNESNKPNVIKDVLSFANSHAIGDRYIIIGVKKNNGEISTFNIHSKMDSAHLQQYILSNITPELNIDYEPYNYQGKNLMILTVKNPDSRPYQTAKQVQFKNNNILLRKNEIWIRKGSHQELASIKDLERIYAYKYEQDGFNDKIQLFFENSKTDNIELHVIKNVELPSQIQKEKIQKILNKKEELAKSPFARGLIDFTVINYNFGEPIPYEKRDVATLKSNLKDIETTYYEVDREYIFEKKAHLLNINLLNTANIYLEDASIEIRISKTTGMLISKKIWFVRESNSNPLRPNIIHKPSYEELNYPFVTENDNEYIINQVIGNLKHNIKQDAFKTPIRIF